MSKNPGIPETVEAQAFLASIITSSDDAIISKDLQGNITSWNPAAERIFGYTTPEAVGKHISLIIPADAMKEEDYILGQIRQGNRIDHFETKRRAKDGHLVNISVTISPIKDASGKIVGASKVARDITQIKEAQRISGYMSAIIESSDDAIISKDLKGFVTSWNRAAERIFGFTADEIVGRHITTIIPAERLAEEEKILTTLRTGKRIDHFETMRRHKDGHLVPVSLTVSPILDPSGKVIGASKISRDISDRQRTEKALIEISKNKDEFLANMSHELRTPMNAVVGIASLLKETKDLPEKAVKYVEVLKNSADNLLALINDLLDFSKLESPSFQLESVDFSLLEEVEKVISIANVKAQEKRLELFVNYSPELNHCYIGDPLRISQILTNLVSNAIKFTNQGSIAVDIAGWVNEKDNTTLVTFKVSDTGIGIEESKIGSIFEKFSQADASITRKYGGSGLGLAIVKTCVERMNGDIKVESEYGIGTTFSVTLPLKNTEARATVKNLPLKINSVYQETKKSVLLVEDYAPNAFVAGAMLENMGYDYDIAQNGLEALKKFTYGFYDVILMDIQMKGLDGLEATRRIRSLEAVKGLSRTPIIAMTAHAREQDKAKCLDAGMDDFIPKPFDPADLSKKVGRYTRLKASKG